MNPLELNIKVEEVPTDLSKCYTCEETIFGRMYQYVLDDKTETKYKLCESCHSLGNE